MCNFCIMSRICYTLFMDAKRLVTFTKPIGSSILLEAGKQMACANSPPDLAEEAAHISTPLQLLKVDREFLSLVNFFCVPGQA